MQIETLLSQSFETIYRDIGKRGLLLQYYSDVFGEKDLCASCSEKVRHYYEQLKSKFNLNTEIMSKFRFKKGIGIRPMSFGSSQFLSNDNMTDEKAIEYLKDNPNKIIHFEAHPKNWKELVEGKKEKKKTTPKPPPADDNRPDEELKLNELRKKYPHIKARSQEEFLKELKESQNASGAPENGDDAPKTEGGEPDKVEETTDENKTEGADDANGGGDGNETPTEEKS